MNIDPLRKAEIDTLGIAGHSLGGTLAAIFASLHPERVKGLILLGSPLNFGKDAGDLAPLFADPLFAQLPTVTWTDVPGSFLSTVSSLASPSTFLWARWMDWLESLPDAQARETHLLVSRWMLDEMPLPENLFREIVESLYHENRFLSGTLEIGGKCVRHPVLCSRVQSHGTPSPGPAF